MEPNGFNMSGSLDEWGEIAKLELYPSQINDGIQEYDLLIQLIEKGNEEKAILLLDIMELDVRDKNINVFLKLACEMDAGDQVLRALFEKIALTQEDLYCLCVYDKVKIVEFDSQLIIWDDIDRLIDNTQFEKYQQSRGIAKKSSSQSLLHQASLHNHLLFFEYLLKIKNANVDVKDSDEETPLFSTSPDIALELIQANANIHAVNKYNTTPLHKASAWNRRAVVEYLVLHGANMELKNNEGQRPLDRALIQSSFSSAFFLLSKGSPLSNELPTMQALQLLLYTYTDEVNATDEMKETVVKTILKNQSNLTLKPFTKMWELLKAVSKDGNYIVLKALVDHFSIGQQRGIDTLKKLLNTPGDHGRTPMHLACISKSIPSILLLIDAGADIRKKNNNEEGAIDLIVRFRLKTVLQELWCKKLIKPSEIKDKECLLSLVCQEGDAEMGMELIKEMQQAGKDLSIPPYQDGRTFLHIACQYGHHELIKGLIKRGADVNALDENSRSPLHVVLDGKMWSAALALIANNANPDIEDSDGYTPIVLAAENGFHALASQLAEQSNDPILAQRKTRLGYSFFRLACENEYWPLASLLFERGGKLDDLQSSLLQDKFCDYQKLQKQLEGIHEH